MTANIVKLSDDIVKVIFSKLPFSNLHNFRVVCKAWNHLVLDYVDNLLSKFNFHPNAFVACTYDFVLDPRTSGCYICNPKIRCLDLDRTNSVAALGLEVDCKFIEIRNSCNGLLLVLITLSSDDFNDYDNFDYLDDIVGILNPMTKEFIQLLSCDVEDYRLGFGFSPNTNQYKLFRRVIPDDQDDKLISTTEVWRFGINNELQQWEPLSSQPNFSTKNDGVYLDGVIYWIGKNITNEFVIYALDVETEVFETASILDVGPHSPLYYAYFQQFEATIYLIITLSAPVSKMQVWVRRAKHLWIKEFVFDLSDYRINLNFVKADEGGVYFVVKKDLLYFDRTGKKVKIKSLFNSEGTKIESIWHIESFHFDSLSKILAGNS